MAREKKVPVPQAMLSGKVEDREAIKFPVYVSEKLDGIRAIVKNGVVYSRSMKPIPNKAIQERFGKFTHFDGELKLKSWDKNVFAETQSVVMAEDRNADDVMFYVFDMMVENVPYKTRYETLAKFAGKLAGTGIEIVEHVLCNTLEEVEAIEKRVLAANGEGVMLNSPDGFYKYGRSSWKEGILLKMKPWDDAEGVVIGFKQKMSNQGEIAQNFAGGNYRVYKREDMVPVDELGALFLAPVEGGVQFEPFNIGTGFDAEERKEIWAKQNEYMNKIVKFRYQGMGSQNRPRNPSFLGFRNEIDMV